MKASKLKSVNEVRKLQNIGPQAAMQSKQLLALPNNGPCQAFYIRHYKEPTEAFQLNKYWGGERGWIRDYSRGEAGSLGL